jgi:RNA methyltransferase, TrmH family
VEPPSGAQGPTFIRHRPLTTRPATAARDPRIARAARLLRDDGARRDEGAFVVDGDELLAEALAAGVTVEVVFEAEPARWRSQLPAGVEHVAASPDALRALASVGQPPRVAAVCRVPDAPSGPVPPGALVLAGVTDAGNVGSIARTAAALGLPRVEVLAGSADPWSRKALRAALGASFAPGVVRTGRTLEEVAAERGRSPLAAAVPRGGEEPAALPAEGVAVVLGSERDGLTPGEVALCDLAVTIPAAGFESLNVAAAAAILGWELARAAARSRAPGAGGANG